jgi:hypothetical protein
MLSSSRSAFPASPAGLAVLVGDGSAQRIYARCVAVSTGMPDFAVSGRRLKAEHEGGDRQLKAA